MRRLYWRPQRISRRVLVLLACAALSGHAAVELWQVDVRRRGYQAKMDASLRAQRALSVLRAERERLGIPIDSELDPQGSGMVGALMTPVTTNPGHLPAKQATANPNWAAVVVDLLEQAGVRKGDAVALGMSGSFPALNVAVLAAVEAMGAEGVLVTSASSSQFGANVDEFLWPDMERALLAARALTTRSVAISRGGIEDRGLGLTKEGREQLDAAIARHGAPRLDPADYQESVELRWGLYLEHSRGKRLAAYVNVGGGTSSVGTKVGKRLFRPGLNRPTAALGGSTLDSVMARFASDGVPVVHLVKVAELARRYDLPLPGDGPTWVMPAPGQGGVYEHRARNPYLVVAVVAALAVLLTGFLRLDWGHRLLQTERRTSGDGRAEPMI